MIFYFYCQEVKTVLKVLPQKHVKGLSRWSMSQLKIFRTGADHFKIHQQHLFLFATFQPQSAISSD
jgi:hypothetical protein